jgi:hypothetical protein
LQEAGALDEWTLSISQYRDVDNVDDWVPVADFNATDPVRSTPFVPIRLPGLLCALVARR